jgi:serine O-acetyltransferase
MNPSLPRLRIGTTQALARHVARQLDNLFPDQELDADIAQVSGLLPGALARMAPLLEAIRNFTPGHFDHFNSLQYSSFLYLLANEHWRSGGDSTLSERLFCLNRALNAIDLFYSVGMPEVFFLSHGLGATLGNARYGNRLVIFQNVTVGRVGDDRPQIGDDVVLYPGAVVTGKAVIGHRSVVGAGTVLHGVAVPDDTVATMRDGRIDLRPRGQRDFIGHYLRP